MAWRDLAGGRVLVQHRSRGAFSAEWTPMVTYTTPTASCRIADDKVGPGGLGAFEDDRESLALAPERIRVTALDAKDLRADGKQLAEGLMQDVVAFTWQGRDVRVLVNPYTHLPTLVDVTRAHPESLFLWLWGDVRTRTSWGNWQLVSGLQLPLSSWRSANGVPDAEFTITRATLDPTDAPWPTIDAAALAAAEERVRQGPPAYAFSGPGWPRRRRRREPLSSGRGTSRRSRRESSCTPCTAAWPRWPGRGCAGRRGAWASGP